MAHSGPTTDSSALGGCTTSKELPDLTGPGAHPPTHLPAPQSSSPTAAAEDSSLPLTFRPRDKDPVWRLSAFFPPSLRICSLIICRQPLTGGPGCGGPRPPEKAVGKGQPPGHASTPFNACLVILDLAPLAEQGTQDWCPLGGTETFQWMQDQSRLAG